MKEQQQTREPDRVRRHTSPQSQSEIDSQIEQSIRFYATQPEHLITQRIEELDREWDMERILETNGSTLALTGALLGLTVNRTWFLLPCAVMGFLFQHAVKGWCPPVPLLRRMGVRTRSEIDREKFALKALRGDFKNVPVQEREEDGLSARAALLAINA